MSDEGKTCPFCHGPVIVWRERGKVMLVEHPNTDCCLADFRLEGCDGHELEMWNTRPREAELEARIKVLEEQLEQAESMMMRAGVYVRVVADMPLPTDAGMAEVWLMERDRYVEKANALRDGEKGEA